ncbi:MAG: hypothetical protein NVSMB47_17010 [Polyangiales bacterium]
MSARAWTAALAPIAVAASAAVAIVLAGGGAAASPIVPPDAGWADASLPDGRPTDARLPEIGGDARPDVRPEVALDAPSPIPPDPTPLACDAVFVLSLRWSKGTLTLEHARRETLAKKTTLPRHFGRFAAELYVGPTLLERLRFDIPLLGDDGPIGDTYGKGLVTDVEVRVPDSERPTRLEIWDRATDRRWVLDYPPKLAP